MPQIGETRKARELKYAGTGRFIWHACEDCGKERWVLVYKGKPEATHCPKCANFLRRKGGIGNNGNGYIVIKLEPNDFFLGMASKQRTVLEHRLVMAKYLNRCLLPWEVVHHKNGIRHDNRLENLELLSAIRYHLPDLVIKSRVRRLEVLIEKQTQHIKLLEWHIHELNNELRKIKREV